MQAAFTPTAGRQTRSDTGLQEYLLVVWPDAEVYGHIKLIEQQFYLDYGVKPAGTAKPHIKVAGFQAQEVMEETLIRWIERICGRQQSFDVTLNNYSGFPPHTIYLRIQNPRPFVRLGKELRAVDELIRASYCPPANLVTKPYLGIATRLPGQVYDKALADYSRKTFPASFLAGELLLLRKDKITGTCKTLNIFRLPPAGSCDTGEPA